MNKKKVNTLVLSDLHLGSRDSIKLENLFFVIYKLQPKQVILNGDIQDYYTSKSKAKRLFTKLIQHLDSNHIKYTYLRGNHDEKQGLQDELNLLVGGKFIKIAHGHKYEQDASKVTWLVQVGIKINEFFLWLFKWNPQTFIRRLFAKDYPEGKSLKHLHEIREHAITDLLVSDTNTLIIGHTHYPEILELSPSKVYGNAGKWDDYIIIFESGDIQLGKL